jgi:hypothetical protein
MTLSAAELAAQRRTTVKASAHDQQAVYEGVSTRELLTRVGVPSGEALRGRDLAIAVVVTGADGYRVAFGVAEIDPAFTDRIATISAFSADWTYSQSSPSQLSRNNALVS